MPTLAHLSDLHLGESALHQRRAAGLVDALLDAHVDHVVLTGDVTHSGTIDEYELFLALFRPLRDAGKLTVIPGNHDRSGDDVAELLSDALRVSVDARDGLFMVCLDSTAPHHRGTWLGGATYRSHGELCEQMLHAVDEALTLAPAQSLSCVMVHHHVLPLPVEGLGEWLGEKFGYPFAAELPLGKELLRRVRGRCDLVLHGHRHVPRHWALGGARPLEVFNAGSSTQLGAFRVFDHHQGAVRRWWWHRLEGGEALPGWHVGEHPVQPQAGHRL